MRTPDDFLPKDPLLKYTCPHEAPFENIVACLTAAHAALIGE